MGPRLPTLNGSVLVVILLSWDFGQNFLDSTPLESKQWTLNEYLLLYFLDTFDWTARVLRIEIRCLRSNTSIWFQLECH